MTNDEEMQVTLDHMNPKHQKVIRFLALGLTPPEIADTIHYSPAFVKKVESDPETPAAIARFQKIARCMNEIRRGSFDQLLDLSIEAVFDVLTSPKATYDQKLRAAQSVMDRHPDGDFVKTQKNVNRDEQLVGLTDETLRELKRIATRTNATVIDIQSSARSDGKPQTEEPEHSRLTPALSFAGEDYEEAPHAE